VCNDESDVFYQSLCALFLLLFLRYRRLHVPTTTALVFSLFFALLRNTRWHSTVMFK
jgi:hypothetical protein